jgi:hypothetical protein
MSSSPSEKSLNVFVRSFILTSILCESTVIFVSCNYLLES